MNDAALGQRLRVPAKVLHQTFAELRRCGDGRRECQVLWTGPWSSPNDVTTVVHPTHRALGDGFELDSAWLSNFWQRLTRTSEGIRVQIHTHPAAAFHSTTDDSWPIIHTPGFLSLVIPRFAQGDVGFSEAYLAKIGTDGKWESARVSDHIEVIL